MASALFPAVRRGLGKVRWYLEGMMGADAYRRYVDHHAATHPGCAPMSERQFWRDKYDWEERNPQGRCC